MRYLSRPIRMRSNNAPSRRFRRRIDEADTVVVVREVIGVVARRMERMIGKKRRPSPESSRDLRSV